jgi:apolipoprotein N-acyltransferase
VTAGGQDSGTGAKRPVFPLNLIWRLRAWVSGQVGWRRLTLAALLGAGAALSFAPFHYVGMLIIAFTGLVWLIDGLDDGGRGRRQAAAVGFLFGYGFFLGGLHWIGHAFLVDPDRHGWMIPFVAALLPAGLALFHAAAAWAAKWGWRPGPARIAVLAAAFMAFEWLRGHVLTGFPWNLPGYALAAWVEPLQIAAWIGIYGLSLITVLVVASFALLGDAGRPSRTWLPPLAGLMVMALIWSGGALRVAAAPDGADAMVRDVRVRIVQPSVPQAEKWRPEHQTAIWERLLTLTAAPGREWITHTIWPESALPFILEGAPRANEILAGILRDDAVLLMGAVRFERVEGEERRRAFNTLHVMDGEGRVIDSYDKHHLVPFGEYVPLAWLLEPLGIEKITAGAGSFTAGSGPRVLNLPHGPSVSPLICYEGIFPHIAVPRATRPGFIVNVTDDTWFGKQVGPYQHFVKARLRAIEQGLPVMRAANNGVSAVIDAHGRVLDSLGIDVVDVIDSPLPVALAPTPYARFGDLGFALLMLLFAAAGILTMRQPIDDTHGRS